MCVKLIVQEMYVTFYSKFYMCSFNYVFLTHKKLQLKNYLSNVSIRVPNDTEVTGNGE